jgi:peptidoglycan/LPS O-acetylase OafA/YrhL
MFDFGFLRGLAGFLVGVLIYQLYAGGVGKWVFKTDTFLIVLIALTGYALHSNVTDVLLIPCFALVVLAVVYNQGLTSTILMSRPLQYLGNISYSLYLMQSVLYRLVVLVLLHAGIKYKGPFSLHLPQGPAFLCCLGYLAGLIVLSAVSYRYIEQPARKSIRKAFV